MKSALLRVEADSTALSYELRMFSVARLTSPSVKPNLLIFSSSVMYAVNAGIASPSLNATSPDTASEVLQRDPMLKLASRNGEFGFDEMMLAVMHGNEECIQLVLAAGGNPEYVGKQLEASLFDAINDDDVPRVRELLKQGADVNFINPEGETALFRALQYGTACDCLPDILAAKPDESIRNKYGRTAWECAKLYGPLHRSGLTVEDLRNMPFADIEEKDAST